MLPRTVGTLTGIALSVLLGTTACTKGAPQPTASPAPQSNSPVPSPSVTSPTVSPSPSAPPAGLAFAACLEGWMAPDPGTPLRKEPLDIIRGEQGVSGLFVVDEVRYFEGPEIPWIENVTNVVKTWYVKATLQSDPSFRGRWLIQRRSATLAGVAAVAPFDSSGFRSPDWKSFEGEGIAKSYPGLPGKYSGIAYDSVNGAGNGFPVLTRTSSGCLKGTGPIQTTLNPNTAGLLSTGTAHVEVTRDADFTGDLSLVRPSVHIGITSGGNFGMDVTWRDASGDYLVLSGTPLAHTSSKFALGLGVMEGGFFVSKAGECAVTITQSESGKVKGSFVCSGLSSSGLTIEAKGSFSGS